VIIDFKEPLILRKQQRLDVVQQKCENEKDAERLAGEKTEMTDKYDSLKSTLETSRSSMMQVKNKHRLMFIQVSV
jgi:hypothetical protein